MTTLAIRAQIFTPDLRHFCGDTVVVSVVVETVVVVMVVVVVVVVVLVAVVGETLMQVTALASSLKATPADQSWQ